jgi:type IV pilus assembly protein PilX
MTSMHRTSRRQQRGVALVIGLIFLTLVSLIATVGMRQSITQERMAGGLRQESLARAGAETAARAGERELYEFYLNSNGTVRGAGGGVDGIYFANEDVAEAFREAPYDEFFTAGGEAIDTAVVDLVGGASGTSALAQQPVYLIEELGVVRQPGAGTGTEGGASGTANYEGSGGGSPAGNSDMYMYRITSRATGGVETVVRTVETTYVVRKK